MSTGSDSVVLGLKPTSTRIGPTGDRYRNPAPGVIAAAYRGRVSESPRLPIALPPTIAASMNAAYSIFGPTGMRYSTLPSASAVPPTGRTVKSRLRRPA